MKNIIFLLILIVISITTYYFYSNKADPSVADSSLIISEKPITGNSSSTVDPVDEVIATNKPHTTIVDFSKSNIRHGYYYRCGSKQGSTEEMIKTWGKDIIDLSKEQLEIISSTNEYCANWYDYVTTADKEEIKSLEVENEKQLDKLTNFLLGSLSIEEKVAIAKSVVKKESDTIHDITAINYLIRNDYEFRAKIANKIGTTNLDMIASSASEVMMINQCQELPGLCKKGGKVMAAKCLVNADNCFVDYFGFLEKNRTINEVADLHNMANAVREILLKEYDYKLNLKKNKT